MGEASEAIVVDTYALMAKATGEVSDEADRCLNEIRTGRKTGFIHPIVTYEFLLQFHRGRLPIFKSADEALSFLEAHFSTVGLNNHIASEAAKIKFKSRELVTKLRRHLSVCDSVTVAVAREMDCRILTGDADLRAVAEKGSTKVIW